MNPLAESFFCYSSLGTELLFTNIHLAWTFFFNVYCLARTFFFGTHVFRVENWSSASSTVHDKYIYTFLKRRTSTFNFRAYILNLVKVNISFFPSKVDSPGTLFIDHLWVVNTISSAHLSAKRARTVNSSRPIISHTWLSDKILGPIYRSTLAKGLK